MAGKAVKLEQTGNRQVNDLQSSQSQATQQLRDGPFGDGNLVKGIKFAGGDHQAVNHGLNRQYQGWVIVRFQSQADAAVVTESTFVLTVDQTKQINLYCSDGPTTVDIWFF